jgi:hypothetical protein
MGHTANITFYSIRRRAANDWVAAYGVEGARELMTHEVGSRTLEVAYLNTLKTRNVVAANLGELQLDSAKAKTADITWENFENLAIADLTPSNVAKTMGPMLNATVETLCAQDTDPQPTTGKDVRTVSVASDVEQWLSYSPQPKRNRTAP